MNSYADPHAPLAGIRGHRVLTPDGLSDTALAIDNQGRISASDSAGPWLDAGDLLVLPGIIDLHGDAFERAIMPRPRVTFPYDNALYDVDRQLLAQGITTEFHGVTLSWEGGLRGQPYAERMFEALERVRPQLGARHCIHLRFETHNLDGLEAAQRWIQDGMVQFVALNDHLPGMAKRLGDDRKLMQYADRAECDIDTFRQRLHDAMARSNEVAGAMRQLVQSAHAAGLQVASHDDPDCATRRYYHQLGCAVAEFPLNEEAARLARDLGNAVIFGAPNVVRGGSHTGAPNAADMVQKGLCDVLTSDYYYPAPLQAALLLAQRGGLGLARAWKLVSANPARAAGLKDRGSLQNGMRADLIVVDDRVPGLPRVLATIVDGQVRYAAGALNVSAALQQAA